MDNPYKRKLDNEMIRNGARMERCVRTMYGEHVWVSYIKGYKEVKGRLSAEMGERCQQCGIVKETK